MAIASPEMDQSGQVHSGAWSNAIVRQEWQTYVKESHLILPLINECNCISGPLGVRYMKISVRTSLGSRDTGSLELRSLLIHIKSFLAALSIVRWKSSNETVFGKKISRQ
jgi:hypothetical protein